MSAAFVTLIVLTIYIFIGIGLYFALRKLSKHLKNRILFPTSNISLYLREIDTNYEDSVRKQWFISFILMNLFASFFSYFTSMNSGYFSILSAILIATASLIPSIWITYYCAYQKRGSAWLLYLIITIPFSFLSLPAFYLSAKNNLSPLMFSPALMLSALTSSIMTIVFWINCIRLRKVNLKRRHHQNALILKEKFSTLHT